MKIFRQILSGSIWLLLSTVFNRLAMFLVNLLVARYNSVEVFGQFSLIRSTMNTADSILNGTINIQVTRQIALYDASDYTNISRFISSLTSISITIILILTSLFLLNIDFIIDAVFLRQTHLKTSLIISVFLVLCTNLSNFYQNVFIGLNKFKEIGIISIVNFIVCFPILWFLIYKHGLNGSLIGVVIFYAFNSFLKILSLKKSINIKIKININDIREHFSKILGSGLYLLISISINSISFWYARVLLIQNSSFSEVGLFDAAFQFLSIIIVVTSTTTSVVLPRFSQSFLKKDTKDLKNVFYSSLLINLLISTVYVTLLLLMSTYILKVFGKDFLGAKDSLIYIGISSIILSAAYVFHRYFVGISKTNHIMLANALSSLTMFVFVFFFNLRDAKSLSISILIYYSVSLLVYTISKRIISN